MQGDELADDPLCPCFCKGPDSRASLRAASAAGSTSAPLRRDSDYSLSLSTSHTTRPGADMSRLKRVGARGAQGPCAGTVAAAAAREAAGRAVGAWAGVPSSVLER